MEPIISLWILLIFIYVLVSLFIQSKEKKRVFFLLALDYEWWTSNGFPNPFRFIVECTVLADRSIHDIDFQLDLIDVNDNPPKFSQSIYYINLTESTFANTIISTDISANDPDSGVAGTFFYYLQTNSSSYAVSWISSRYYLFIFSFVVLFSIG
jgi:hypothetical protein